MNRSSTCVNDTKIGYVGIDVPVEVILAAGALPVRLSGVPDMPTPLADRFVELTFTAQSRSLADQWLAGQLDSLQSIVLPRSDDSAQRLYYYICELQRREQCSGPRPILYDLPLIARPTSTAHAVDSTHRLARELGARDELLEISTGRVDARRSLIARLLSMRSEDRPPRGTEVFRLVRTGLSQWSHETDESLTRSIDACERISARHRILLIGSVPPDERIHAAVEAANGVIVGELNESSQDDAVSGPAASIEDIARWYHEASLRRRSMLQSEDRLREAARCMNATGAIIWMVEEDAGMAWELPRIRRVFEDAGIPTLALARQRWSADQATLSACSDFVRSLERR